MRKLMAAVSVMFLTSVGLAGDSFGFTATTNLDVSLSIQSMCTVSATSGVLDLDNIYENTTGTVHEMAPVTFNITCSDTTPWVVTDDKGGVVNGTTTDISSALISMSNPADTVPYSVHYTPNAGTGIGAEQVVTITADAAEPDYTGKPSSIYTDAITFIVTY